MKRTVGSHVVALIAALAVIVAVSAAWIVNLRMGPRLDGFTAGPMVIFVPFGILILTAVWLIVRGVLHGRVRWTAIKVGLASLGLATIGVAVGCGPIACFAPGPDRLMGWFLVGGVALTALVHHVVLNSFALVADNA
ncbi:MAG: hypothetical protein WD036_04520 [Bauldia sp.]